MCSARLVVALMSIALAVFCCLCQGFAPWPLIACYWAVLTLKNLADFLSKMKRK